MKLFATKLVSVLIFAGALILVSSPVSAYAPNVKGTIYQNTGAPLPGIWIEWTSQESGDDGNQENRGTSYRYAGTNESGDFLFKGWDLEGTVDENGVMYSNLGKREYEEKINLDYDDSNGKEARRATNNKFDIFNCHNEVNTFSLRLPESMKNMKVEARWRRESDSTSWSPWAADKVSLAEDIFNNSHDYEIEFKLTLPKQASIRDMDSDINPPSIANLSTQINKVPACIQVKLCTGKEGECASNYTPAPGKHRVSLSAIGDTGIGDARRKLTNNASPIWLVECIQEGTIDAPTYTCTTGNAKLDEKIFGIGNDNANKLAQKYGYSSKIFYTDGTPTVAEITDENKQDVYEWETTIRPDAQKRISSVYLALYEDDASGVPLAGDRKTQKLAKLGFGEGCRLVIDPYGKTFDSYTLEPLAGVAVTLLKQREGDQFTPVQSNEVVGTWHNPQRTSGNGKYNFVVPQGNYRMQVSRSGYQFPPERIHPNAEDFFSNLYTGNTIHVVDDPIYTDIPLSPLDKKQSETYAHSNPIVVESYFISVDHETMIQRVEGVVSHPKAIVEIYGQTPNPNNPVEMMRTRKLGSDEAETSGYFEVAIPMDILEQDEIIGEIEAKKKPIPGLQNKSSAAIVKMQPMLASLEGFATNAKGVVIPNAKVDVRLLTSETTVVSAQADDQGFFTIPTEEMPSVPYTLAFYDGTGETVLSTSTYLSNNAKLSTGNNFYASSGSNVLGDFDKSTVENPLGSMETENQSVELAQIDEKVPAGFMLAGMILVIFVISVTALLSVYITHESKVKRRR